MFHQKQAKLEWRDIGNVFSDIYSAMILFQSSIVVPVPSTQETLDFVMNFVHETEFTELFNDDSFIEPFFSFQLSKSLQEGGMSSLIFGRLLTTLEELKHDQDYYFHELSLACLDCEFEKNKSLLNTYQAAASYLSKKSFWNSIFQNTSQVIQNLNSNDGIVSSF